MNEITGFERANGTFGIRNHVLVLPTVACVNGVVNRVAREVPESATLTHAHGCGRAGAKDLAILFRILSGMIHNPNVGGAVLIGLGCEVANTRALAPLIDKTGKPVEIFNVQEEGGSLQTAKKAADAARGMLARLDRQKRRPLPWDKLLVSLECGGSDALSGLTANVALGAVSDWLVEQGATAMFGENTEMIGTDHILARRARNDQVAADVKGMVDRAERLSIELMGGRAGRVITPGNMEGGMSTIAEKSMGCIFKGGTSTINEVVGYGEAPVQKGLVLQDGPGYDVDSLAGFAAGGSQLVLFSTGRGTPAGFPTVPVIKVASNATTYEAMKDDMDVNAGTLVEGKPLKALRDEMIDLMIRVINGERTRAERNGMDTFSFMTVQAPF